MGIKTKGIYTYDGLGWHQNQSAVVVKKAAEAALVHGKPIPEFIKNHDDEFDFMLRTKVPKSSHLEMHTNIMWGNQVALKRVTKLQNITRYYVSVTGGYLKKVMPPTPTMIEHWNTGDHYMHESTGDYKVVKQGKKPPSGRYKPVALDQITPNPSDRYISIESGWTVTDCSNMDNYYSDDTPEINYEYYITEARKLVDELLVNNNV